MTNFLRRSTDTDNSADTDKKDEEARQKDRRKRWSRRLGSLAGILLATPNLVGCDFTPEDRHDGIVEIDAKDRQEYTDQARTTTLNLYDQANTPNSAIGGVAGDVDRFQANYASLSSSEETDLPPGVVSRDTVMTVGYGGQGAVDITYRRMEHVESGGPDGDTYRVDQVPLADRQWSFAIDDQLMRKVMEGGISREEMRQLIAESGDLQAGTTTEYDHDAGLVTTTHATINNLWNEQTRGYQLVLQGYEGTYPIGSFEDGVGDLPRVKTDKDAKEAAELIVTD